MTFEYSGATPVFTSGQGDITSVSDVEVPSGGSGNCRMLAHVFTAHGLP